jgi:hypothetical protein
LSAIAGRSAAVPVAGFAVALVLSLPTDTQAQAWLPVERETSVSTTYQQLDFGGHFDTDGSKLEDAIPSRAHLAIAEFEYGLTSRFAFNMRLPYVASKFTGDHDPDLEELKRIAAELCPLVGRCQEFATLDTGGYYATAQDYGFMLRYSLLERGLAAAPFVAATIPSHDYRTVGEAAPGQNRRALHVGINAGRFFDRFPGAYVHARYMYSFVQPIYGISLDRSNAEFEAGYIVVPRLAVRGLAAWQQTHGGVSWTQAYDGVFDSEGNVRADVQVDDILILLDHDRLLASRYWHVGGGATFVLTESLDLNGALLTFVSGADTHYGIGLTIGLTWRFQPVLPRSPSTRFRPFLSSR